MRLIPKRDLKSSSFKKDDSNSFWSHPPPPQLAFRVGVVGHRHGRLKSADPDSLNILLREILLVIKDNVIKIGIENQQLYASSNAVLTAVSPLAEGVDRIFAEQAIQCGYELSCPMPFAQEEYEKDFSTGKTEGTDSLQKFRDLLEKADKLTGLVRYEMDGKRNKEGDSFRYNAQIVLNQSDLLIVVWDGFYRGKPGGTEETLSSAMAQQIPIIWIDASAPHRWQLLHPDQKLPGRDQAGRHVPGTGNNLDDIGRKVREILEIPSATGTQAKENEQVKRLFEFYCEKQPHWNFAFLWKFFRNLTGANKVTFESPRVKPFVIPNEMEEGKAVSTLQKLDLRLLPYYNWPDKLADTYANRYRSGYIMTYLLSSLAVGIALFPILSGWMNKEHFPGITVCTILEAIVIMIILGIVFISRKSRWHGRWLDYRTTAESIRQLKLFVPLGGGKPFPKVAAHLTQYGNPSATWMAWYVQSIERMAGLPSLRVDNNHLKDCLTQYSELLTEQKKYHKTNALLYHKIDKRLHHTGELTLWLTLFACVIHLLPVLFSGIIFSEFIENGMTFLCGFLPALGASMAGIHHQGEFKRIAKSSGAMYEQFSQLENDTELLISTLSDEKSGHEESIVNEITDLARTIANLMINEVSDWKVVYQDRPPTLPA